MKTFILNIPIVLLVFNRPEHTRKMFEMVRMAKPPALYIVADGPRTPEEVPRCQQVRAIVEDVDWDCEIHRNYAEQNMGLKARISSGLDWVFEQTEMAIILEDDCVPHPDFFRFCQELLYRYRDNEQVMHITGDNFGYKPTNNASYYFTHYAHVWGWATWRRAWQYFDRDMTFWEDIQLQKQILSRFDQGIMQRYWRRLFEQVYNNEIETWDYPWQASCLLRDGICAMPRRNLVTNIGAGEGATNTLSTRSSFTGRQTESLDFPLVHPEEITVDKNADWYTGRMLLLEHTRLGRIFSRLLNSIGFNPMEIA